MCGRFSLFSPVETLRERFDFEITGEWEYQPRYNIAPSQQVLAIIHDGTKRRGGFLRWGLIPTWAKDKKIGYKMINARGESVHEKPSFKRLLHRQRCLILSTGFYEWAKTPNGKVPYFIRLANGEPFAFAGLWDRWEQNGEVIHSCTVITTIPNELMEPIHNRMPSILRPDEEEAWLDPHVKDTEYLKSLLKPYPTEEMIATPVSTMVNSPANDRPECIAPFGDGHV
ncbi:SOS response-associated peptidase [Lihuaxuella thermophila]|uniref:Abasic site processing protein n=1 Tax=Lihuaxuella thermophila TaxID=1173111 RepID=A0A1H8IH59_9BACL|nr:SOS response-associated peptidase [Lihuaxuella thermophila]SEN67711.1 Putative SOS response-associated peptidase YedK [Lihuaxuella thermophila]